MAGEWKKALEAIKDPAKKAELEKALSEVGELADELDKGYMRQADYSRQTQELKTRKEQLEANWEKANQEYVAMQQEVKDLAADKTATQAEKLAAEQKLKDAEEKLAKAGSVDTSKFMSKEDFDAERRKFAAGQTAYFGDVLEIADEHQELFGKRIKTKEFMQEAIASGKPPRAFWEEKYGVQAKRDEIAKAASEKLVSEAEKRGYDKRLAEEANPNLRSPDASKNPFFEGTQDGKSLQPWDVPEASDAEKNFVKELQEARG